MVADSTWHIPAIPSFNSLGLHVFTFIKDGLREFLDLKTVLTPRRAQMFFSPLILTIYVQQVKKLIVFYSLSAGECCVSKFIGLVSPDILCS